MRENKILTLDLVEAALKTQAERTANQSKNKEGQSHLRRGQAKVETEQEKENIHGHQCSVDRNDWGF